MLRKIVIGAIVVNFLIMLASVVAPTAARFRDNAIADNTSAEYLATCTVDESLEINAKLYRMLPDGSDIDWSTAYDTMDFGTLSAVKDENETTLYMGGNYSYAAVMYPATSGREYDLVFSGETLSGDQGGTIGDGGDGQEGSTQDAYLVTPDYQWQDLLGDDPQGEPPAGASVGLVQRVASANNHVLYTSGSAGFTRAVRAYLGVGGPPESGVVSSWSQGHNGAEGQGTEQEFNEGSAWDLVQPDQTAGDYSGSVTFTLTLS